MTSRAEVVWRYLPSGMARVKHALPMDLEHKTGHGQLSLCKYMVGVDERWLGGSGFAQRARLVSLPECRRCAAKLDAGGGL